MSTLHFLVPEGVDDPGRPSGGNVYDRRLSDGLADLGWTVRELNVPGSWPCPGAADRAALARILAELSDRSIVLVDGLVGSAVPDELAPHAVRLRLVALVHLPLGADPERASDTEVAGRERAVLRSCAAVVTTSRWTRRWLLEHYGLDPAGVHVAEPGVEPGVVAASVAPGSPSGGELLCVAAVTPTKGQDLLVEALAALPSLAWRCTFVGALDRDPGFAAAVRRRADEAGIGDRVRWPGPRTGTDLDEAYDAADLLVLPSRAETFGMVVPEALAHGLPVVATDVGGVPDALGRAPDGTAPGLLVPPGDPVALAASLHRWLVDEGTRERLRRAVRERRTTLRGWPETAARVAHVLEASGSHARAG